jgi:hypothetical protein
MTTRNGFGTPEEEHSLMMKRFTRPIAVACLLIVASLDDPRAARAQQSGPVKVSGKVFDDQGKPVDGATVSSFWVRSFRGTGKDAFSAIRGVTTKQDGSFSTELQLYGRDTVLFAVNREQKAGGLATVEAKAPDKLVTITLKPLTRVHGSFSCTELGKAPVWTNVYISTVPGEVRVVMNESEKASFDVPLPPGTYQLWGYGSDVDNLRKEITVKAGAAELDLGTLDLPATIIAKHKGKALPDWCVTDARGVKKEVKLADFKGKWVLMEFWGFW